MKAAVVLILLCARGAVADFVTVYETYCGGTHGTHQYKWKDKAMQACWKDTACPGVFDLNCDGQGPLYLCPHGSALKPVGSSYTYSRRDCVYQRKGHHSFKPCACPNGTPVAGSRCPAHGLRTVKCASCNHGFVLNVNKGVCTPSTAVFAWERVHRKRCGSLMSAKYHSLSAAEQACLTTHPRCAGIYDAGCDHSGIWRLCKGGFGVHEYTGGGGSCVYISRPAKRCPCQHGTPAIQRRCPAHGGQA